MDLDSSDLNLSVLVSTLAKQDPIRESDLAKSFKYEAPRSVATLAVASAPWRKLKAQSEIPDWPAVPFRTGPATPIA